VHLMPGSPKERNQYGTDITAVAGDEDLHRAPPSWSERPGLPHGLALSAR
jgi:hypothetical protein